jgi:hypothetical protein
MLTVHRCMMWSIEFDASSLSCYHVGIRRRFASFPLVEVDVFPRVMRLEFGFGDIIERDRRACSRHELEFGV